MGEFGCPAPPNKLARRQALPQVDKSRRIRGCRWGQRLSSPVSAASPIRRLVPGWKLYGIGYGSWRTRGVLYDGIKCTAASEVHSDWVRRRPFAAHVRDSRGRGSSLDRLWIDEG